MTVLLQSPRRISVALTGEDMAKLGITYENMDLAAAETRRAFFAVLDEACRGSGVCPRPEDGLLVESLPCEKSGCILIFSYAEKSSRGAVCRFDSVDDLLDCICCLPELGEAAELYLYQGDPVLLLQDPSLCAVLCEYGEIAADVDGDLRARVGEFGERLELG